MWRVLKLKLSRKSFALQGLQVRVAAVEILIRLMILHHLMEQLPVADEMWDDSIPFNLGSARDTESTSS